jgi:hypothetical protein
MLRTPPAPEDEVVIILGDGCLGASQLSQSKFITTTQRCQQLSSVGHVYLEKGFKKSLQVK